MTYAHSAASWISLCSIQATTCVVGKLGKSVVLLNKPQLAPGFACSAEHTRPLYGACLDKCVQASYSLSIS